MVPMLLAAVGGLGIFMLGMKYMSEGMQAVAGNSLRRMISYVTDNRVAATGTGTGVTLLVQSSTVTTVIVVGLVNAGLMQLHQAIGVIMGANIGTTITGWILVLQVAEYGLPVLGAAALVYLFARQDRPRFIAMAIMGLGMIFFGLELMKEGFEPMRDDPAFMEVFAWFQADTYPGLMLVVLIGALVTFVLQSSSATLAITIGLASTGVIPFTTAAALILGENIGTTMTVLLASLGTNTAAKRAAYAHVLFNLFGVFWITLIFAWYVQLVAGVIQGVHGADPLTMTLGDFERPGQFAAVITASIALTHTGFNVANTLLFLPFLNRFSQLLKRIVPDPSRKEVHHLKHLDPRAVSAPVLGIEQSRGEVVQMGRGVMKMVDWIRQLGFNGPREDDLIQKTYRREEVLDNIQSEVVTFLTDVLDSNVPHTVSEEARRQLRIAHEYESISDRLASVLRDFLKLGELRLELPPEHQEELRVFHDQVGEFLRQVTEAYESREALSHEEVRKVSDAISEKERELREEHLRLMTRSQVEPNLIVVVTGILTNYRRVRAHALNIHEAMANEEPADAPTQEPAAGPEAPVG